MFVPKQLYKQLCIGINISKKIFHKYTNPRSYPGDDTSFQLRVKQYILTVAHGGHDRSYYVDND